MERGSGAATWTVSGQRGEVRGQWHPWSHLFGTYRFDQNSQHHVNAGKYRNRYSCSCVATTRIFLFFPPSPRSTDRFREDFEISFPVTTRISLSCQLFFELARPTRRQSETSNRSRIDDHGLLVRSMNYTGNWIRFIEFRLFLICYSRYVQNVFPRGLVSKRSRRIPRGWG